MERKKSLSKDNPVDTPYEMHRDLLAIEMQSACDLEPAMHRLQTKYGLDYWRQWQVRYRRAAKVAPEFIERMRQARLLSLKTKTMRYLNQLQIEQEQEKLKGIADAELETLLAKAEALLAEIEEKRARVK